MGGNKSFQDQYLKSIGSAYSNSSEYGMMPPVFSPSAKTSPESKQDVRKRHQTNTQFVASALSEMEQSNDLLEKNSAEWVRQNAIKLFVGTQTHDSEARGKAMLNDPDDRAYFGAKDSKDIFPSPNADYDENTIPDWNNCRRANKSTSGVAHDDYITLFDPILKNSTKDYVKETIVHEVQHHADHHEDASNGNANDNVNEAWIGYKTEFRGYWVEGSFDHLSETPSSRFGMSPKQNAIYTKIYTQYDYVSKFLNNVVTTSDKSSDIGQTLISLINSYRSPDGINLENSLRIENLYSALQDCKPQMQKGDPQIELLKKCITDLTEQEANEIFFDNNKNPIIELIDTNLNAEVAKYVKMLIAEK